MKVYNKSAYYISVSYSGKRQVHPTMKNLIYIYNSNEDPPTPKNDIQKRKSQP